jgi:hypothetical protein
MLINLIVIVLFLLLLKQILKPVEQFLESPAEQFLAYNDYQYKTLNVVSFPVSQNTASISNAFSEKSLDFEPIYNLRDNPRSYIPKP